MKHPDSFLFSKEHCLSGARHLVALVGLCLCCMGPVMGQPEVSFTKWSDVESSQQFRDLVTSLKNGGAFDDSRKNFISDVVLPQFANDNNFEILDDVRKRVRDRILMSISSSGPAFEEVSVYLRDALTAVARDSNRDIFERVNAVLFISEMTSPSRTPWAPALDSLASLAQDTTLGAAVRITALTGMSKHLSYASRLSAEELSAIYTSVVATLPTLLPPMETATPEDPLASRPNTAEWLASRGLKMAAVAASASTPELQKLLVSVVNDESWSFDTRVRAAITLGKSITQDSQINPNDVMSSFRKLAIASLDNDRVEAKEKLEMDSLSSSAASIGFMGSMGGYDGGDDGGYDGGDDGGDDGGGYDDGMYDSGGFAGTPAEDGLSVDICRRAAWRLYSLGEAILPDSNRGGLVSLLKDGDRVKAQEFGQKLKDEGLIISEEPYGYSLLDSLDELDPDGIQARTAEALPPEAPKEPSSDPSDPNGKPTTDKPSDSPFDSPFD